MILGFAQLVETHFPTFAKSVECGTNRMPVQFYVYLQLRMTDPLERCEKFLWQVYGKYIYIGKCSCKRHFTQKHIANSRPIPGTDAEFCPNFQDR